jgi:two-component system phosphate regulon sensor histidine kinase PhoR
VYADSEKDPNAMENHKYRLEIARAATGATGSSLRYSTTVKESMLYVAVPLVKKGETLGVLRISLFLKDINQLLARLQRNILWLAFLFVAIALAGAVAFVRALSKPIHELNLASRRIAEGDFSPRVFLKKNDELKDLADNFNYMAEHLSANVNEISKQRQELASIISSIEEGLLVVGSSGEVILSNDSFKNIIGQQDIEGKPYWEVVREHAFSEFLKRTLDDKRHRSEELPLYGKYFLSSITPLKNREEFVVILHDITEIKDLEKIKRDFVVNVSHELRTPLTAIKGFVETLKDEVKKDARHYVDIIERHTNRLIYIVQDLLLLSELEEKGFSMVKDKVNVGELIEHVSKIFHQRAKDKGLNLSLDIQKKLPAIHADAFKIEQLFINLIDNAIKYTEDGSVKISVKKGQDSLVVEIKDTGIGIDQEHINRIFERFYVVDASRSKRSAGTGLGLSIVKHIVLLHNGTINVESLPARGTTFTVILPVA